MEKRDCDRVVTGTSGVWPDGIQEFGSPNRDTRGGGTYHRSTWPSVSDGKVFYQDRSRVRAVYESTTRVIDVATGEESVIRTAAPGTALGATAVTGSHVYWLLDEIGQNGTTALRRAGLDGSGVTDLSPETGSGAGRWRRHGPNPRLLQPG
ncbi:hypothetical protein E0500_041715 [Streptomyces sp. KM273126]|uniref:hypothetical protein n=1 Tax=Streptomyces sp. KM273126 TaxID=2545247 RepID=UPI0015EC34CC|nr:hypothetical protein [Streptomyces sp. KM273126]MBA2813666.1 hypothetical protein [Streptomyces sp. KM273126]